MPGTYVEIFISINWMDRGYQEIYPELRLEHDIRVFTVLVVGTTEGPQHGVRVLWVGQRVEVVPEHKYRVRRSLVFRSRYVRPPFDCTSGPQMAHVLQRGECGPH